MKTSELSGAALDWAVQDAEYRSMQERGEYIKLWVLEAHQQGLSTPPWSTDWQWGGPIIEREGIELKRSLVTPFVWWAAFAFRASRAHCCGPTPLIAGMRCFVASKLGDEVEVPKELE